MLSRVRGSVTNNNGLWIGLLDVLPSSLQLLLTAINYNSSQSRTVKDSLHSLTGLRASSVLHDWFCSDLRIGHFFSLRCPLVSTPQLNIQLNSATELNYLTSF
jgi:hypothetical protein